MERVAVTGGNGFIGEAVLHELDENGYETINLDQEKHPEGVADNYLQTNLLDAGEVYGSLARSGADAVVHLGTIAQPTDHPGYVTYRSNVMTTYNVLEVADDLGVDRVCLPSSINVLGGSFQDAPIQIDYLPVDENHPVRPRDPYSLAKQVMEVTAEGIARRDDAPSITTLRFPAVRDEESIRSLCVEHEWTLDRITDYGRWLRAELFAYVHRADAAQAVRKSIETDLDGHERFWIVADDTIAHASTEELVETMYEDAKADEFDEHESLVDNSKAKRVLGWKPEFSWRRVGCKTGT